MEWNFSQLCQRPDGSFYGIASGKQCLKGRPVSDFAFESVSRAMKSAGERGIKPDLIRKATVKVGKSLGDPKFTKQSSREVLSKVIGGLKPTRTRDPKKLISLGKKSHEGNIQELKKTLSGVTPRTKLDVKLKIAKANNDLEKQKQIQDEMDRYKKAEGFMDRIKKTLFGESDLEVSKTKAKDILKASPVDDLPKDKNIYYRELAKLNAITNNQVSTLEKIYYTRKRAYAARPGVRYGEEPNDTSGRINVGLKETIPATVNTLWHEYGHHLEYSNNEYRLAALDWLKGRSNGEIKSLKELIPNAEFRNDERAYVGNYISPYVGKVSPDGTTEVISMGLERFSSPERMLDFYQQDPEHFFFILGILSEL